MQALHTQRPGNLATRRVQKLNLLHSTVSWRLPSTWLLVFPCDRLAYEALLNTQGRSKRVKFTSMKGSKLVRKCTCMCMCMCTDCIAFATVPKRRRYINARQNIAQPPLAAAQSQAWPGRSQSHVQRPFSSSRR